jgi:hypothetical protein
MIGACSEPSRCCSILSKSPADRWAKPYSATSLVHWVPFPWKEECRINYVSPYEGCAKVGGALPLLLQLPYT